MRLRLDEFFIPHLDMVLEEIFGILPPAFAKCESPATAVELAARSGLSLEAVLEKLVGLERDTKGVEIGCEELASLLKEPSAADKILLLDVREPWEFEICHLPGSILLHAGDPEAIKLKMVLAELVVTICHHGIRSFSAAMSFRSLGISHTKSLAGGLDLWARLIDESMPRY